MDDTIEQSTEDFAEVDSVTLEVPAATGSIRVDRVLSMLTGCSRSRAVAEIEAGHVRLGRGTVVAKSQQLSGGDLLEFPSYLLEAIPLLQLEPDPSVAVAVVYCDESLLVIDKAAGQVVHPGVGNPQGTLVAGVVARYPEIASVGERLRPGIVHRLDRPTSGLMVVARTEPAYVALSAQMRLHEARRTYIALVGGVVEPIAATLDGPIGKSRKGFASMEVSAQGRWARTHYRRIAVLEIDALPYSVLSVELETGRTHQIRVHMASHGFPIYGDALYGSKVDFGERIFLHAARLGFNHPQSDEEVTFSAPLPEDLMAILRDANFHEGSLERLLSEI